MTASRSIDPLNPERLEAANVSNDPNALLLFLGGSREQRAAAVRAHLAASAGPDSQVREDTTAASWPFRREITPDPLGPPLRAVWLRDLHHAFTASQTSGTRLVLTQSTYQLQRWLDWLVTAPDTILVADADRGTLVRAVPEAAARRGPWARIQIVEIDGPADGDDTGIAGDWPPAVREMYAAFHQPNPDVRLATSQRLAVRLGDEPALHLAHASACMELQHWADAEGALDRARALAPDWEAVHFEAGKLWLRTEDTARAADAFAEAGRLMPHFAAAFSNLGAALGELDRGTEALRALQTAFRDDPRGYPVLNNIGAVLREQGQLAEAADAFRRVIALAPQFVFGYYNLGHTLLLDGRFPEARDAYEDGFERDAQKNARQACRLAVARAAAADADAAIQLLEAIAEELPREAVIELFGEAESTLMALSAMPDVSPGISRALEVVRRYSS